MQILITGGAGFIGSNIADYLIEQGKEVIIVDNLSSGKKENINKKAKFYQLDIRDQNLEKVFQENKISHVIHHAAQIDVQQSIADPIFDAENNILGTINLLENCREYGAAKIIYASSAAVYGEPEHLPIAEEHPVKAMSPYGITKHTVEHYLKMYAELYDLKYTILRYANAYGPRQDPKGEGGVVSIFLDKADNQLLNISTAVQNSINQLVEDLNELSSYQLEVSHKEAKYGDIRHSALDNTKAKEILGWEPQFDLKSGLKQTYDYYTKE